MFSENLKCYICSETFSYRFIVTTSEYALPCWQINITAHPISHFLAPSVFSSICRWRSSICLPFLFKPPESISPGMSRLICIHPKCLQCHATSPYRPQGYLASLLPCLEARIALQRRLGCWVFSLIGKRSVPSLWASQDNLAGL